MHYLIAVLISLFLVACGGSSTSSSNGEVGADASEALLIPV